MFKAVVEIWILRAYHTLAVRSTTLTSTPARISSLDSTPEIRHLEVIDSELVKVIVNFKLQSALCHHLWHRLAIFCSFYFDA